MHPDQLTPDVATVTHLVAARFPHLAGLAVRRLESPGTVNALFRVGPHHVARVPLHRDVTLADLEEEFAAAHRFRAAALPVATPEPLAIVDADDAHPVPWSLWRWIDGRTAYEFDVADDRGVARDLAAFVRAVRTIRATGETFAGDRRGGNLRDHDEAVATWIDDARGMVDTDALTAFWHDLRDTPHDPAADTVTHGDLMPGNLLVAPGALVAVLDTEIAGVADPAVDLAPAWNLFDPPARAVFRAVVDVDDATWRRGQAWSLVQAIGVLAYYRVTNPVMSRTGARTLAALLADAG